MHDDLPKRERLLEEESASYATIGNMLLFHIDILLLARSVNLKRGEGDKVCLAKKRISRGIEVEFETRSSENRT